MNIQHLKYAVEIEKTNSLSKAAENLFMAQPNLSRAIKELEVSLDITIFDRTSRGMIVTPDGEEFLQYAKNILKKIEEVEEIYTKGKGRKQFFAVSVPRASYISYAFTEFVKKIGTDNPYEFFYRETNSMRAINNILHAGYKLGIIRYATNYDEHFKEMLAERNLYFETIAEFGKLLTISKNHPLSQKQEISQDDLTPYTEIAYGDPYVPLIPTSIIKKDEQPDNINKRIYIFERASQFDLLSTMKGAFMWDSIIPKPLLEKHNLLQLECGFNQKAYKDVVVYKKDYRLSKLDKRLLEEVAKTTRTHT